MSSVTKGRPFCRSAAALLRHPSSPRSMWFRAPPKTRSTWRSGGVVPVALLSSSTVDATKLDYRALCFGDAENPAQRDCSESHGRSHLEDVNRDGRRDMVLHFDTRQTGIDLGDTRACVNGRLPSGKSFEACDVVRVR